MAITLGQLADELGADLHGDARRTVTRVATLDRAQADCVSFLADPRYRGRLAHTQAAAVILAAKDVPSCPVAALVVANPYLAFAQTIRLLHPSPPILPGIHPSAVVASTAQIDPSASIGPLAVIESEVIIGARVAISAGCIVQHGAQIGADSQLRARVVVGANCVLGERVLLHPGAIIGRDGFGFARDGARWVRIPQIGRVVLGDDVEIGANSCVDRGALEDTCIEAGAKLDSLIQIGHNVHIGENTAMAACSGISGSTRIGRNCTIAGAVGMAGHLEIGDEVHFTGMAMVTRSVSQPGIYSSGIPAMPNAEWRRTIAHLRRIDQLVARVQRLETQLQSNNSNTDCPKSS